MQPKGPRYNKNIKLQPIKDKLQSSTSSINSNNSTKTDFNKSKNKFNSTSEKFKIDLNDQDKKLDEEFMNNLSDNERQFYKIKARELYEFLSSINLIRFIESFIKDGFEGINDIIELENDYFEINKNFTLLQQKKILEKVKEYKEKYTIKKNEMNEIGVECDFDYKNDNINIFNRCWTCFKKLDDKNLIEKTYTDSIVTRKVRFCSKQCMEKFEKNIYVYCDYCNIIFDKSKGDFVFEKYHFHSKECLDKYIEEHNKMNYNKLSNIQEDNNYYNIDENKPYDPMEDF